MQKSIRLLKVWKLLREKRMITAPKLAKMCAVTERTIYRDINALEEAGVLLSYDGGYYIAEENPLPQFDLTPEEQLVLTLALQHLPLHLDKELEEVVNGLLNKLLEQPAESAGIALGVKPAQTGKSEVFSRLKKAIEEHREVTLLNYRKLIDEVIEERRIEPYLLAFRERSWYLVAWTPAHERFQNYRLDRIGRLRVEKQVFHPRPFDPQEHFRGSWGVAVDHPQRLRARFTGLAKQIVKKSGRFSPAEMREEPGSLLLETTIKGEFQWLRWLLGFGGEAEVLEPPALREKIRRMLREALARYEAPGPTRKNG